VRFTAVCALVAACSPSIRDPDRHERHLVWCDARSTLVLEETISDGFPDSTASCALVLDGRTVLADSMQVQSVRVRATRLASGDIAWTLAHTLCRAAAGRVACADFPPERCMPASDCCTSTGWSECRCGLAHPSPALAEAMRWVVRDRGADPWLRAASLFALVELGDRSLLAIADEIPDDERTRIWLDAARGDSYDRDELAALRGTSRCDAALVDRALGDLRTP